MYEHDERIVMTLDAGGTNFVFSAIQGCREIVEPICLPAASDDLERCLSVLVEGFLEVEKRLPKLPVAISFAFPGPADYEHGIIGDLPNFPAFRGGVALGPYLREQFGIPVFINNDGNLFAYGEALAGTLPEVNKRLKEAGSSKVYKNLLGITLGTGFGAGHLTYSIVIPVRDCQNAIFTVCHCILLQRPVSYSVTCGVCSGDEAAPGRRTDTVGIRLSKHHSLFG